MFVYTCSLQDGGQNKDSVEIALVNSRNYFSLDQKIREMCSFVPFVNFRVQLFPS